MRRAGPSWSCTNIPVTVAQLEAFEQQYKNTDKYQERERKKANRKYLKEMRLKRTK